MLHALVNAGCIAIIVACVVSVIILIRNYHRTYR